MRFRSEDVAVLMALRENSNLEQAARQLGLSQPTLSRRLQALERELGLSLFWSSGRRKRLSPQAEALCARLAPGLEALSRDFERWRAESASFDKLRLRVGGRFTLLSLFFERSPLWPALEAVDMPTDDVVSALVDGRIDVGITAKLPPRGEFLARRLSEDSMVVAVRADLHPVRDLRRLLCEVPGLAYRPDLASLVRLATWAGRPAELPWARVMSDWSVLVALAEKGLGWLLVPRYFVKDSQHLKLFELPAKLAERMTFHIIVRRELKKLSGFSKWWSNFV